MCRVADYEERKGNGYRVADYEEKEEKEEVNREWQQV